MAYTNFDINLLQWALILSSLLRQWKFLYPNEFMPL